MRGQEISSTFADGSHKKLSFYFSIPVRFKTSFSIIKFYLNLSNDEKNKLSKVVAKFNLLCTGKLGRTDVYTHKIETRNAEPVSSRCYPISPALEKRMSNELDRMISLDVIEPADSPWCQPPVLVKKSSAKDRFCVDCRALNKLSVKSKYAVPRIDTIFE